MLNQLRNEIDAIDEQMLTLLEKRLDVAKKVGDYKKEHNLPVFVPTREEAVIENRVSHLKNPAYRSITVDFFSHLMSLSRRVQEENRELLPACAPPVKSPCVAYLGKPGSNSAEALPLLFPQAADGISCESFNRIVSLLNQGKADYGILPIENTSTGAIDDVLDLLYKNHLFIVREAVLEIRYVLAAPKGARLVDIRKVYSHSQGLLQCAAFLETMPNAEKIPTASTADGALLVAEKNDGTKAAVVSPKAAALYGLVPLKENIQTASGNTTRFVAISRQMEHRPEADKISLAFTLKHQSGSLCQVLAVFAHYGLNLLYIESRPLPGRNFEYMFFADFSGSLSGKTEQDAIKAIQKIASSLQILGNYPAAKEFTL